jgi:hypothetical protein
MSVQSYPATVQGIKDSEEQPMSIAMRKFAAGCEVWYRRLEGAI